MDGTEVKFIDPLFITPGLHGFDLDEDRAVALEPSRMSVEDSEGNKLGEIKIRYSVMPPTLR